MTHAIRVELTQLPRAAGLALPAYPPAHAAGLGLLALLALSVLLAMNFLKRKEDA